MMEDLEKWEVPVLQDLLEFKVHKAIQGQGYVYKLVFYSSRVMCTQQYGVKDMYINECSIIKGSWLQVHKEIQGLLYVF